MRDWRRVYGPGQVEAVPRQQLSGVRLSEEGPETQAAGQFHFLDKDAESEVLV